MIRKKLSEKSKRKDRLFRWRGGEVSRLEGLTDAVFAFSITLLVVSLEVPKSFDELLSAMQGFIAFGITLTAVIALWYGHYTFFRRYGLEDGLTIILNSVLLFVVLFYIYPLKFLATLLINYGLLRSLLGFDIKVELTIQSYQWAQLMIIYGIGFLAISLVFVLFHVHAYRKRLHLKLNEIETLLTRASIESYGISVVIAVISISIVSIGGAGYSAWAGWIYALIGPASGIHGAMRGKKIQKLLDGSAEAPR